MEKTYYGKDGFNISTIAMIKIKKNQITFMKIQTIILKKSYLAKKLIKVSMGITNIYNQKSTFGENYLLVVILIF